MKSISYKAREIEGEQLELTDKEANYYLGPDLTLRRCTLVLRVSSRWLNLLPTRLMDCTIDVKQELKNFAWTCAALKGCRFKGRMVGCDFGPWRDYTEGWEYGAVEECDFSEARLNNCRFHGCDPRTLRLPAWPHFTILDPLGRSRDMSRVEWPGRFGRVVANLHTEPPSTVAVTLFAPTEAERYGTTPEELRAALSNFDFILC